MFFQILTCKALPGLSQAHVTGQHGEGSGTLDHAVSVQHEHPPFAEKATEQKCQVLLYTLIKQIKLETVAITQETRIPLRPVKLHKEFCILDVHGEPKPDSGRVLEIQSHHLGSRMAF